LSCAAPGSSDFDVLDQLYEERLISGSRKAKTVYVTEAITKAEELARVYLETGA
jgi:hypothetical protein